jgi:RimJ/RimL family protein N-acetyltransferase
MPQPTLPPPGSPPQPASPRLGYRSLTPADLDGFHALLRDEHVRRFLLDGELLPREAAVREIAASELLHVERHVGLWLVSDAAGLAGFCGFRIYPELERHPHLLYALLPRATGRGLATEMTKALIAHAAAVGFAPLRASVDEVNAASVRVLEKCGFRQYGSVQGAFGPMRLYER